MILLEIADINECERYPDICGPQQSCMNIEGGHICVCNTGFVYDLTDPYGRTCQGNTSTQFSALYASQEKPDFQTIQMIATFQVQSIKVRCKI